MSTHHSGADSFSFRQETSTQKQKDDQAGNKATQSSVTLVYHAKIADLYRNVTVTWSRNLINYSLIINVESPFNENQYTCKIDIKGWQFWGRKGLKSFNVDHKQVSVFWDFRHAKFSTSPEPCSDYYVAMVSDEEVVLLLGDSKKDVYKRTKTKPSIYDPVLLCKKENLYGKRLFCTKATLDEANKDQDIIIENCLSGPGDPEMWISVGGYEVIRVMNLNWRFRGNEIVTVNNMAVQIFWDVHDWLFGTPGTGSGLFVFQPAVAADQECDESNEDQDSKSCSSDYGSRYDSPPDRPDAEFCHIIYAWKVE